MRPTCKACVLFCIDFRFREAFGAFLADQRLLGPGTDVVRVAGSVLTLARPAKPGDRAFLLKQLVISDRLHDVTDIYLVNHEDCGAYGAEDVPDDQDELSRHAADLAAACDLVNEVLPEVRVHMWFLWLDGRAQELKAPSAT